MNLEELKKEADDLGIEYSPNIGAAKLAQRIEDHYAAQEDSIVTALQEPDEDEPGQVEVSTAQKPKPTKGGKKSIYALAREAEERARKTQIVTIIDNDNRINNLTTTCTVNCSNMYFDLGTVIIPLNEKVEVFVGHLNVLKSVQILQHAKDPRDKTLSKPVQRPRYTIQYEDQ